jgi:hypothetical protein
MSVSCPWSAQNICFNKSIIRVLDAFAGVLSSAVINRPVDVSAWG